MSRGTEHFVSAVHDQLYAVTDLWLVQLPFFGQELRAQHTWYTSCKMSGPVYLLVLSTSMYISDQCWPFK